MARSEKMDGRADEWPDGWVVRWLDGWSGGWVGELEEWVDNDLSNVFLEELIENYFHLDLNFELIKKKPRILVI